jgi:hypothetical protein
MHACGDDSLAYKGDLGGPKRLECVDCLDDAGADGLASDPGLVLLALHLASLDDTEANVDDVDVVHLKACSAGVCSSGNEVEDEGIKPIDGVPINGHALPVCLVIIGRRLTILVDKLEEEVDKDNIRLAEVPLLEGSVHLGQHGLKEDVVKGSYHFYNVCSRLHVLCVRRVDYGSTIVVNAHGVVGHVRYLGQEGREGVGVRFHGEESVDIARSCTEEQVHCHDGRRSLCLGTVAEVKRSSIRD